MTEKYSVDVQVWLERQNHPIEHKNAKTYQKGSLFCVYEPDRQVTYKYPIDKIWRVREGYPNETREHIE